MLRAVRGRTVCHVTQRLVNSHSVQASQLRIAFPITNLHTAVRAASTEAPKAVPPTTVAPPASPDAPHITTEEAAALRTATAEVAQVQAKEALNAAAAKAAQTMSEAKATAAAGEGGTPVKFPLLVQPEMKRIGDFEIYNDSNTFCWVFMDRQDSSANSIGRPFLDGLEEVIGHIQLQEAMGKLKAVILTSKKSTFCVGADVREFYPITDQALIKTEIKRARAVMDKWTGLKVPTIAAINGIALGGGLEIALACDYRVCNADDEKVMLGLPEVMLGVLPGLGGTVRTPKLIGLANALQHVLTGKTIRPSKAKRMGLVDAIVDAEDRFPGEARFIANARAFAGKQVDKKRRPARRQSWADWFIESPAGRYIAGNKTLQGLSKDAANYTAPWKAFESVMYATQRGVSFQQAMDFETEKFAELCSDAEAKNLMALYFLDDGTKKLDKQPSFSKDDAEKVSKVGIVGAGVMGSGAAQYFASKKKPVYMNDISEEMVKKGKDFCDKEFGTALKRKQLTPIRHQELTSLVTAGTDTAPLKDCKVIVEAAVERMDIKKKMLQDFEAKGIVHANNYFATNTSSLSITELATVSKTPERIVGMHFFNPVKRMALVEVIRGKQTSPQAIATIYKLALDIGKKPIVVGDCPGFLVNRVLGAYLAEAGRLLEEGADPREVDKLILKFGMPMGPFRLIDEVGLDVAAHVAPVLEGGLGSTRFTTSQKIKALVSANQLGKKTKKGFYTYDEKEKQGPLNEEALKAAGVSWRTDFDYSDVVDRLVLPMANEAAYILDEGIARAEDVDLGMVFGTGFAPFRGGLLNYIDQRGIAEAVQRMKQLQGKYGPRFQPHPKLEKMAASGEKFFPSRPNVSYQPKAKQTPKYSLW